MTTPAKDPSVGIDAFTGGTLTGWDHVVQSLNDIFATSFGTRYLREWYGSFVPEALGRNITPQEILPVIASITSAIEQWEPRFRLVGVTIDGEIRQGNLRLTLNGVYRPRALLGDDTEAGARAINVALASNSILLS